MNERKTINIIAAIVSTEPFLGLRLSSLYIAIAISPQWTELNFSIKRTEKKNKKKTRGYKIVSRDDVPIILPS